MLNVWKASSLVLAGALALVVGRNAMVSDVAAEPQPAMKLAEERLIEAKRILEAATPDKGGHRVKAIGAVKLAIEEVREGIKYDNEHKVDNERKDPPAPPPADNDTPKKPVTKRVENPK
jgi:hypothetical protein